MRNAFITALTELAARDERIILLTGDLGFSVFEDFEQRYPDRFYNFGISEQNMVGAAAGLALCGKKAIAYSIATFASMRTFEQIRVDVCFQKANVIIVGTGGGYPYGSLGPTHHATEDIGIMRTLPNLTILSPGDPIEADLCTRAALAHKGPVYLRIGKGKEPVVHTDAPRFSLGKSITLEEGSDATIMVTGDVLTIAHDAARRLSDEGLGVRLVSMPCLKPLDEDVIRAAARETRRIVTVEEHQIIGGLGSAVAEVLSGMDSHAPLTRIGVPDRFMDHAGSQDHLREVAGITVENIMDAIRR